MAACSNFFASSACYGILIIHIFAAGVFGQANGVNFTYPTPGLTVYYLDTLNVSWTSNFSKPKLFTFCRTYGKDTLYQKQVIDVTPFNGSHLSILNYDKAESCYFNLRPNMTAGYGANSPSVRVVQQGRSSTTLGVDSPGTTATGIGASLPSNTIPPDGSADPTAETKKSGLSTGAKAGVGVGAAAGGLGVAALAAFFLMRRRKQQKQRGAAVPSTDGMSMEQKDNWSGQQGGSGGEDLGQEAGYGAYKYGGLSQDAQQNGQHVQQGQHEQQPRVSELPTIATSTPGEHVFELGGESRPVEAPGSGVTGR